MSPHRRHRLPLLLVLAATALAGCQAGELRSWLLRLAAASPSPTVAPTLAPTAPPAAPATPAMPVPAAAQLPVPLVSDRMIAPGVRWMQFSGISPHWKKPLFVNAIEFDPADPAYRVAIAPAHGRKPSYRESTRRIAKRVGALAAVNGSYFYFKVKRTNGDPIGLVISEGALINPPRGDRPALGVLADGRVFFGLPTPARDPAAALQVDRLAALRAAVVPTPAAPVRLAAALLGDAYAPARASEPEPGSLPGLGYPWDQAYQALEGGPMLVHEGRAVPLAGFNWTILHGHEPRTAVGMTAAGKMLWLTVDGRRPGHSLGTDLGELTRFFLALGAIEAMNWDGGGSTTMVIQGQPVTKIATGWVREVANALVLVPATASLD